MAADEGRDLKGRRRTGDARRELDEEIARLQEGASAFVRLGIPDRIALARAIQTGYLKMAERIIRAGCEAKGIPPGTLMEGEEWSTGPWCVIPSSG